MPKPPTFKYTRRCRHEHVSGRRCGARVGRDAFGDIPLFCGFHKGNECAECKAMMAAFTPPKGWTNG